MVILWRANFGMYSSAWDLFSIFTTLISKFCSCKINFVVNQHHQRQHPYHLLHQQHEKPQHPHPKQQQQQQQQHHHHTILIITSNDSHFHYHLHEWESYHRWWWVYPLCPPCHTDQVYLFGFWIEICRGLRHRFSVTVQPNECYTNQPSANSRHNPHIILVDGINKINKRKYHL